MATAVPVTGEITDPGGYSLTEFDVTLKFMLSGAGESNGLVSTRPIDAPVTGKRFAVNLVPTDEITPARWYTVLAEWRNASGNYTQITLWERFYVPSGGGDISTFPNRPLSADSVWVSLDPPPAGFRGWWLQSKPGNPAMGTDTGSGDFWRVS